VKRLVELHGGSVSASSEGPGLGSEFTVPIPALIGLHLTKPVDPDRLQDFIAGD
jgi:hypothetical protein